MVEKDPELRQIKKNKRIRRVAIGGTVVATVGEIATLGLGTDFALSSGEIPAVQQAWPMVLNGRIPEAAYSTLYPLFQTPGHGMATLFGVLLFLSFNSLRRNFIDQTIS